MYKLYIVQVLNESHTNHKISRQLIPNA